MFTTVIDTDNSAFDEDNGVHEICRILDEIKNDLLEDNTSRQQVLRDINGNKVGEFIFYY